MKQIIKVILLIMILSLIKISYCYKDYDDYDDDDITTTTIYKKKHYTVTDTITFDTTNTITDTIISTSTSIITSTTTNTVLSTPYCQKVTQNNINNAFITSQFEGPLSPFTYADCAQTCFGHNLVDPICFSLVRIPYPLGNQNPQYICSCYNSNYVLTPLDNSDPPCVTIIDSKGNPFIYGQGNFIPGGGNIILPASEFVYCANLKQ